MSKHEGSHGPQGPWAQNHKTIDIIKIMKINVFFEHGTDAHRDFEKGALNESSRSLIWSFWEQIVFSKNCEKSVTIIKIGLILGPSRVLDH